MIPNTFGNVLEADFALWHYGAARRPVQEGHHLGPGAGLVDAEAAVPDAVGNSVFHCPHYRRIVIQGRIRYIREGDRGQLGSGGIPYDIFLHCLVQGDGFSLLAGGVTVVVGIVGQVIVTIAVNLIVQIPLFRIGPGQGACGGINIL